MTQFMVIAGEVEKIVVVVVGAAEQSFPINHASEKDCRMLKAGKVKREKKVQEGKIPSS